MNRILILREKAKKEKKKVVLPEGKDKRIIRAASFITAEGMAEVSLLGGKDEINKVAEENNISLDGVGLVDPLTYDKRDEIIDTYFELRKHKGITREDAEKTVTENLVYYAAMMTRLGIADGFVAGACHTTSDVARAAIQCLKLDKEVGTVSSSFIIELDDCPFGENGLFAYGDCGIIPYPSTRQLAGIAIATSDLFHKLFGIEPRVAMLSYSTKGSAKAESVHTILEALDRIKRKRPELMIDGELQLDAAIIPEVARLKCPDSEVAGRANVLIFPNLDAGNISYKLTQRLGKARAVGPLMQGLDRPCSDLSRGCSWEDVVDTAVATAVRAQGL
ncbi:MAG: phosphate acetyltransferase [Candidatus Makaraimicrobium thalassicum]|nr:MAG: phosphate acetyltransferase [Candidatus Omnitrophota bacterium]